MKIYVIGDPHFKSKNALETNEMVTKIYTSIIEEKPDFIVVLGDVLDTHETIHVGPLCRATDFLFQLSKMSKHLFVLVGNHDRPNNSVFLTQESPFNACKSWEKTNIVDKVLEKEFEGKKFLFVPYVPTGRLAEALATENITSENINKFDIVFAHQEFKGCNMGMITSNEGDPWDEKFPLCISGHIHDYQVLQPNLIYPGTPIQHGFGDSANKAVMILESDKIEDLNPVKYSYRRINLNLPKKLTVHITSEELVDYVLPENSFVKLIVTGESDKVREVMKLDKVKQLLSSERIKLSIQEIKKKKNELNVTSSLLAEVISTQFVPFQERLKKVIGGEVAEVQDIFKKLFGDI
jgi:DNA repair exonuclease SbcCD nuclease subunit